MCRPLELENQHTVFKFSLTLASDLSFLPSPPVAIAIGQCNNSRPIELAMFEGTRVLFSAAGVFCCEDKCALMVELVAEKMA